MRLRNIFIKIKGYFLSIFCNYTVASVDDTLDALLLTNKSLIRFGDGELRILIGKGIGFQESDEELRLRLMEILSSKNETVLLAVPGPLGDEYQFLTPKAREWWRKSVQNEKYYWNKYLSRKRQYYNALVSRFYVGVDKREDSERIIKKLKLLWERKRLLIIEGNLTKNGVGNDLFNGAKEVKRILCPAKNAFRSYNKILEQGQKYGGDFDLILISLGPTAKVLAYDLNKSGYRAIDIGHIDNEYEWFLKGKHCRSLIDGKYVNEIEGGDIVEGVLRYNQDEILCEVE